MARGARHTSLLLLVSGWDLRGDRQLMLQGLVILCDPCILITDAGELVAQGGQFVLKRQDLFFTSGGVLSVQVITRQKGADQDDEFQKNQKVFPTGPFVILHQDAGRNDATTVFHDANPRE